MRTFTALGILLSFTIIKISTVNAAVWPSKNSWSEDYEMKYAQWVKSSWTEDIFTHPQSPLQGIETDCADMVYTARAYFSYLNELPFKSNASSSLDNSSTGLDSVSSGLPRFRAFVRKLVLDTSSRTLPNDTYPIAIDPKIFRAGIIYVAPGNHSYLIKAVERNGLMMTYSSTVPAAMRMLLRLEGVPFYIPTGDKKADGYRAWRQPHQLKAVAESLPYYSEEQYQLAKAVQSDYIQFSTALTEKLSYEPATLEFKVTQGLKALCSYARERGLWVSLSSGIWESNKRCMRADQIEDYSTYSRDKRLKDFFQYLRSLARDVTDDNLSPELKEKLMATFTGEGETGCLVETYDSSVGSLKLAQVWQAIAQNKILSNPHATIQQRWGLADWKQTCEK